MERQNPSIFNDILGPIMVGPSSSHTCGPTRIGFLCRQLIKTKLVRAEVAFAKDGAYTNMYKGQRSDMGFTGGLLGFMPEDVRIRDAFAEAKKAGVAVEFLIEDFAPVVPNLAILRLWGENGEYAEAHTDSTGGGTVRILNVNGMPVDIVGDCFEILLFCNQNDLAGFEGVAESLFGETQGISTSVSGDAGLLNIKLRERPSGGVLDELGTHGGIKKLLIVEPVLSVLSNRNAKIPFRTGAEVLQAADSQNKSLSELAVEYEMIRGGFNREQVIARMDRVIEIMECAARSAVDGKVQQIGILKPSSAGIYSAQKRVDAGVLNTAVPWAMGVMEFNSDMGIVVCAPTGGAAGVIPGAVLGTASHMGFSQEQKRQAMFAAGLVGIVMAQENNFSAELYGCQIEPGAASAMAAGGLVEAMGGSPAQAFAAAATAIHNVLGIICDPVAGLVELPCISRNAMCAANAVVCANMVLGGYDPVIGIDESTETLFRVGREIPSHLRCTGLGGLCVTCSGHRLNLEQEERNNKR